MIATTGPIGYRQFVLEKKCNESEGHLHNYDHTTFVHRGKLKVITKEMKNGVLTIISEKEYEAGEFFLVPAQLYHTIKALEDNTVYYCIFSHRDWDGLITQKYIGNNSAYESRPS